MENPTVMATTLSVMQHSQDSVTCQVDLNDESCNLTLRFENESARLCGYRHGWKVWDEMLDEYDDESFSYEDLVNDIGIEELLKSDRVDLYVSRETEKEILTQLKVSLKNQFDDEMFKYRLSENDKEEVLRKVDNAISKL